MGTDVFSARGWGGGGGKPAMDYHPQCIEILLVAQCYGKGACKFNAKQIFRHVNRL